MKIIICGVTGVIGQLTLSIVKELDDCEIVGITFGKNIKLAKKITQEFLGLKIYSPIDPQLNNINDFNQMLIALKPDLVINAVSGFAGLNMSLSTIKNKISLGLANKESIVLAGWYILELAKNNGVKIFPIDSEHSSIFDILENSKKKINSLLITMSGGKYFNSTNEQLELITFDDAIKHPKWNMGYKISIDSSTFMNKCYEMIEAFYFFNSNRIRVVHHPEALIHALVEFDDFSLFSNMSNPDMRLPIILCLNYFGSKTNHAKKLIKPLKIQNLSLSLNEINPKLIKPILWATELINSKDINKAIGVILISANEIAIELFKARKISYLKIIEIIEKTLFNFKSYIINDIDDIFKLDFEIKNFINKLEF